MRISGSPVGRALGLFLLALSVSGCAESVSEAEWMAFVDTLESGVPRVSYRPPAHDAPTWTLSEEFRLGGIEGDGPAVFGRIKSFQVSSNGNVAVLDAMAKEIRVFDASGQHLSSFGGQGEGPGEFQEPFGLVQDGAGRLWVPDFRLGRISVLDETDGFREAFPMVFLRRGFIWDGAMTRDDRILDPSITLDPPRRNILRVYDQRMNLEDSLPLPDDPPMDPKDPPSAFYVEAPSGSGFGYVYIPGFPIGSRQFDGEGLVWSTDYGDFGYRVKHWQPGGDTLLVLEVQRAPVPVPTSERDSLIDVLRERLQRRGGARQDWSKVPQWRPSVISLFVSEEGNLWVQTPTLGGATLFDHYDFNGSYLGSVSSDLKLAAGIAPIVRGDQLWAVVTDDLDVQYVVRARIIPPPSAH